MTELSGRTVLLTGASSGLGPYIARRLHVEGARLVLSARRQELMDGLARELVGSRVVAADLSRREDVARLAQEAGEVDVLVANAGVRARGTLLRLDDAEIDTALEVNLRAPIVLTRRLLPLMVAQGSGHIVLIASMSGQVSTATRALYSATKFGLRGFGHGLRPEVAASGVGVSLVSPYFVSEAGMWAESGGRALGEVRPERVADAVVQAIRTNRSEITVAPLPIRVGARFPMAFPQLLHLGLARRMAGPRESSREGEGEGDPSG